MRDGLQKVAMRGILAALFLTRKRAVKAGGIAVIALSALYLVTAIIFGPYSPLRWDIALALMFASIGAERLGIITLTIPTSRAPYRIDGIIELIGAAMCLTLAIFLPVIRANFAIAFVVLLPVGLARVGVQPWRA